jgi:HEAT repeat protein
MRLVGIAALVAALATAACAPPATEGGFDSANPAARLYAIEQAAREGDRSAVTHLVELLDSDDPAVRWMSIVALERLTGQTHGYHHYDPPQERREAVMRWVQYVEAQPALLTRTGGDADD